MYSISTACIYITLCTAGIRLHYFSQGSKCEEWKDEKKSSATVLYTQIINLQPVYTVHGTHFAEGSAAP